MSSFVKISSIQEFLELIHPGNARFQIMSLSSGGSSNGTKAMFATFQGNHDKAALAIQQQEANMPMGLYVNLNHIVDKVAFLGRGGFHSSMNALSKEDFDRYQWLAIDIDSHRPPGQSATDDELAAAKDVADHITKSLREFGFGEPVLLMSGNGYWLMYRIDLETSAPNKQLIKLFLTTLSDRFSTSGAKVDTSVSNPSRCCKVAGTTSRKGPDTSQNGGDPATWRRHRQSWFRKPKASLVCIEAASKPFA